MTWDGLTPGQMDREIRKIEDHLREAQRHLMRKTVHYCPACPKTFQGRTAANIHRAKMHGFGLDGGVGWEPR